MDIAELLKHQRLGIDFDDTLIGHPRSHVLQQFILDQQGEREFHIITHRSHGYEHTMPLSLRLSTRLTGVKLDLSHFTGIHSVPWYLYAQHAKIALPPAVRLQADAAYYGWKAVRCKQIGCTVLIDDNAPLIGEHCLSLGIVCLHPDDYDSEVAA